MPGLLFEMKRLIAEVAAFGGNPRQSRHSRYAGGRQSWCVELSEIFTVF
ncbi:MAG: hypothetical protein Q8N48_01865 [Thiobacillus sp.]|nr:hypothetical protein [Thiobacillus sp.]MDP2977557.1 hypothetical protein [Thiobacillus sp.]